MTATTLISPQQFAPDASSRDKEAGNDAFFDVGIWILVLLPLAFVIVMAALKKKSKPELPHVTDMTWEVDVVESELPVILHAYTSWSIGDRVIEEQAEKIRNDHGDRYRVLWFDVEKNPGVISKFPTLTRRTLALFVHGRLLWQSVGVHDAADLVREVEETLAALGKTPA